MSRDGAARAREVILDCGRHGPSPPVRAVPAWAARWGGRHGAAQGSLRVTAR